MPVPLVPLVLSPLVRVPGEGAVEHLGVAAGELGQLALAQLHPREVAEPDDGAGLMRAEAPGLLLALPGHQRGEVAAEAGGLHLAGQGGGQGPQPAAPLQPIKKP